MDLAADIQALAGLLIDDGRSVASQDWTAAALGDGGALAGRALGLIGGCVTAGEVVEWVRQNGLTQIVTPEAPVGPVREALSALTPMLSRSGVRLVPLRRPYDALCWPHATKGFFAFKERIPHLLAQVI